jgi:hypothetical protein
MRLDLTRLQALVLRSGNAWCSTCGLDSWPAEQRPADQRVVAETEARFLAMVGGVLFAAWPRCAACGRLDPAPLALAGEPPDEEDLLQLLRAYRMSRPVSA